MNVSVAPRAEARPVLAVFAIGAAAAFLLCGYEFIRSVSSSLFIEAYGARRLPIAMALGPVGTLALIYLYGVLLSLGGPCRALLLTSGLSALVIAACYLGLRRGFPIAAGVAYVFREGYIVLLVEQYWSFINSVLVSGQARKCNGPITGVASLGAIAGGLLVNRWAKGLGSETLLLFAAVSLIPAGLLAWTAYRWGGEPRPSSEEAGGRQGHLALKLLLHSRYLLLIAGVIFATQVVSTVLDLRFSGLVEAALPIKDERTAFFGGFYATLNAVAGVLQFLVAPLLLHYAPLRGVHASLPLLHCAASLVLLLHPALWTGGVAFLLFKAMDYSIFRAGKEIFYIPLPFDARYRAKEVIDAFGYRFAKGTISGLLALAGRLWGTLPGSTYPILAMLSAGFWLALILRITRTYQEMEAPPR